MATRVGIPHCHQRLTVRQMVPDAMSLSGTDQGHLSTCQARAEPQRARPELSPAPRRPPGTPLAKSRWGPVHDGLPTK